MGLVQAWALLKWVLDHEGVVEMEGTVNPARPSDIETSLRLYTKEIQ